jgi:hypothetical protein
MAEIAFVLHQPLSEMGDWSLLELMEWRARARRLHGSLIANV